MKAITSSGSCLSTNPCSTAIITRRNILCNARPQSSVVAHPSPVQSCQAFSTQSSSALSSRQQRLSLLQVNSYAAEADYETDELNFRSGDVVDGVVDGLRPYGAFVKLGGTQTSGLLHVSQVSGEFVQDVADVLEVGEPIKVLILRVDRQDGRISLSTKRLERNPGDMLTNRQAVWDGAEEMAAEVRQEWADRRAERQAEYDNDGGERRERRNDGEGFRGRGRGGGGRGRGGGGRGGGGRGYNRDGGDRRRDRYE